MEVQRIADNGNGGVEKIMGEVKFLQRDELLGIRQDKDK